MCKLERGTRLCLLLCVLTACLGACRNTPAPEPPTGTLAPATAEASSRVLPTPYFTPTLVRAPVAWTRSRGSGVTVAVTRNHGEDLALVNLIAPEAQVLPLEIDRQIRSGGAPLIDVLHNAGARLLAILEPGDFDTQALRDVTAALTQGGRPPAPTLSMPAAFRLTGPAMRQVGFAGRAGAPTMRL